MIFNLKIKDISFQLGSKKQSFKDYKFENPDWNEEKIKQKTGIENQFILSEKETPLSLAEKACHKLSYNYKDIDLLIYITQAPDYFLPSGSCILQDKLKLKKSVLAFDINLGCSGFIYGLSIAGSMINSKLATKALIICSDGYSKYISKSNRTCRPIFSDAGSATIVEKNNNSKIGPFVFGTDGVGSKDLIVEGGAIRKPNEESELLMNGSQVFLFTLDTIPNELNKLLMISDLKLNEVSWFVFHQASKFVIDNLIKKMDLPKEKVITNYAKFGNTVSSSIPICLSESFKDKQFNKGDKIILAGFGVGLSWGLCVVEI
tara:strand:+ start:239 stop:1192 length:954 start_codon:yes stop_codon:yes gene_type:complete